MNRALVFAIAAASCAVGVLAQDRTAVELQRMQRTAEQGRAEVDRLLDLRLRHDLGLPTDGSEGTFRHAGAVTTDAVEQMRNALRDEDGATASLLERFQKLRAEAETLRVEAAARAARETEDRTFVRVPTAGSAPQPWSPPANTNEPVRPVGTSGAQPPTLPAPHGEARPARPTDDIAPQPLDPLKAQIHGSTDHRLVGQALFKAGQALMDRAEIARRQGQAELAHELDNRGRERIQRALDELAPMLQAKDPAFVVLFLEGRCRELLFRYSERYEGLSLGVSPRDYNQRAQAVREPFLRISARDVQKTGARGEVEVLGEWGQAAQTALMHFAWMNQHAGYDVTSTIEALTWPGERQP
jgi:hypothetical protein